MDLALTALAGDGYWGLSIDDLCRRAGVSRATFYQYFEGKASLFRALSADTGADVLTLGRRLGPLGPHPDGVRNLHAWLRGFQEVYLRHAPVFELWSEAMYDSPQLRATGEHFIERYTGALSARLVEAGAERAYASRLALAVLGTAERISLVSARSAAPDVDDAFAALAAVVQVMLFPATPHAVLREALTPGPPTG
jgi:AcrR family transcriptional regulator